jgi:Amino acid synthesis
LGEAREDVPETLAPSTKAERSPRLLRHRRRASHPRQEGGGCDSREGDCDAQKEATLEIRKVIVQVEETWSAAGREVTPPTRTVVAAAVVRNPLAGSYVENLGELEALGAEVAAFLAGRAVAALGTETTVTAYGKGAIVGLDGELEHAAAILHPRFGAPVRAAIGGGAAIIPSTKKVAGAGASLTMPITNKDDIWSFDEMDAAEITIPDAPRPDEVVVCVVLASGGRPHARTRKPV